MKNAFNQEASMTASQMVNTSKMMNNSFELEAVHHNRPSQVLKMKKPEQILMEVRSKKIAELNQYKSQNAERKVNDIENLLKMMNTHSKLPNTKGAKGEVEKTGNE